MIDIIAAVNADLSVAEGHSITEESEENLRSEFNINEATIHGEPSK